MEIRAEQVEVTGAHSTLLRPTSLAVSGGELLVVAGDPGTGHTALALALSGRLKPSRGRVLVDGAEDARALRHRVSLVDAPEITEPEPSVPVAAAVAEGLSLAGRRSGRRAVRSWLAARDLDGHAATRVENLPAPERLRLLVDLACADRRVAALVLDTPDRHGGDPHVWYELARRESRRERAVLVLCSPHSADRLDVPRAELGADNSTAGGAR
ncbi:ATP-binding cassette domain-containing protein [Saccharopolyspora sp. MS10]|uniref:ATP-binding cassette domain-containing protein n=1 Tax=Saccharopolyspora sp. MS10 TaxID=3385973 RepID=UPI0039A2AD5A